MINVQELRIGNWVNQPQLPHIAKITAIDYNGDDYYCKFKNIHPACWCSHIEPIALTEDILLKCGFEKSDSFIGECLCCTINNCWIGLTFDNDCFNLVNPHYTNPIKYVHELQNLYFDLTKTELNIQL